MDFFEAQDQARRSSKKLVFLFIIACICVLVAINGVALLVMMIGQAKAGGSGGGWFRPEIFALVSVATLAVIVGGSLFKTAQLSGDGGKVARLLGGRPIDPHTNDPDERKLLNIVEEMSIASGVPVPDTYVIDNQDGINAFAAGNDIESAAIGVTRGCIARLTRDELQGVIAHEYSHILNGDMKLNLRLIGVIFGLLVIGLIGYVLLRSAPYGSGRSRSNSKDNGAMAMLLIGAAVWLIGSVGVFFGRLIQASVSRQREFLADASAVQFTRNPNGIRDALRRIGGNAAGSNVQSVHAGEISHMFFANGFSSMFATHPPLPQRIKAIDKNWDGTFLDADAAVRGNRADIAADDARRAQQQARRSQGGMASIPVLGDILARPTGAGHGNLVSNFLGAPAGGHAPDNPDDTVAQRGGRSADYDEVNERRGAGRVGMLDQQHIDFAHAMVGTIPQRLRTAAHDPVTVRGVVYGMFLAPDAVLRQRQLEDLHRADPTMADVADACGQQLRQLGPAGRLPVLMFCNHALRQLSARDGERAKQFLANLRMLSQADRVVEPFEYALYKLASRWISNAKPKVKWAALAQIEQPMAVLLSGLAAAGNAPDQAPSAFARGAGAINLRHLAYQSQFSIEQFDTALDTLAESTPAVKRQVIEAASAVSLSDATVTVEEAELLRAISTVLQCPLPPIFGAVPAREQG